MFRFIKKIFIGLLSVCTQVSFRGSLTPKEPKKCLTLNSRPCQARPTLVNIDSDETLFIHFLLVFISVMEFVTLSRIHPYARVCVPNKVRNMNVKEFNLISRVNERRF